MLSIISNIIRDIIDKCLRLLDFTKRAMRQFRKQLTLVIAAKSGHIEQHFD